MNQATAQPRVQPHPEAESTTIRPLRTSDSGAGSRAPIQTWTGKAIAEQIHSRPLGEGYRHWLFHRASRQPILRDMYSKTFCAYGDTLLNLKLGDEYVVVSQSESYVRNLGQDLRGVRMSDMKFASANSLREIYDLSLATRQPVYARYISSLSDQNLYWEVLVLPLALHERSAPVFCMSFVAMLSEKIDVLQVLYDRSPLGIIAAVPLMNGQNKTEDARILTLNTKAREILRQDPSRYPLHTVGELLRYLGDPLGWTVAKSMREGQATRIDYRSSEGDQFSMSIEYVHQILLISLAELRPEESEAHQVPEAKVAGRFARMMGIG